MKSPILISLLLVFLLSCKKEKNQDNNNLEIPNPMTEKNGWNLVKHTPDFFLYKNNIGTTNTLNLVKEHATGIDVLYSSIFQFQSDLRIYNVRWRAYDNIEHDVQQVVINEIVNSDPIGRPIISELSHAFSMGMGENDLYAVTQLDKRDYLNNDPPIFQYDYFNVKKFKNNISSTKFNFKNTQANGGISNANPTFPFVCNGMNARILKNPKNIYATGNYLEIIAAAPKA